MITVHRRESVISMKAILLVLLAFLSIEYADAKSCRLYSRVCTEPGGNKNIGGHNVYQDCWRYSLKYLCKTDTFQDSCLGISSSGTCKLESSTCTKTSLFGDCEISTSVYKCGQTQTTSPGITELPPEYTTTQDSIDYSQCAAITDNPTCKESSNICTEGAGSKVINGLTIYKECWKWSKSYTCKGSNFTDTCQPLQGICEVKAQKCTEMGEDGVCNNQQFVYDCDELHDATGIKLIDSNWTITKDIVDHSQCNELQNQCYLKDNICTEQGGTKIINGLPVTKDCWRYEKQYVCGSGNNVSTCKDVDKNKCTLEKKDCITSSDNGKCAAWSYQYKCEVQGKDTTVENCSTKTYCINGDCFDTGYEPNSDFGVAVAYLNGAIQAGVEADPNKIDIFTGTKETCSLYAASSVNCCKDDGWANGAMGGCDDADKRLIERRKLKLVHYVGTYCAKKIPVIGTCIKTSQSFCAYDSMLSRIIQEGARPQLGMSWGSAESPTCSGMTPEQLQDVDFTLINFQEYIDTLTADIPSNEELQQKVQDRVIEMTK